MVRDFLLAVAGCCGSRMLSNQLSDTCMDLRHDCGR